EPPDGDRNQILGFADLLRRVPSERLRSAGRRAGHGRGPGATARHPSAGVPAALTAAPEAWAGRAGAGSLPEISARELLHLQVALFSRAALDVGISLLPHVGVPARRAP